MTVRTRTLSPMSAMGQRNASSQTDARSTGGADARDTIQPQDLAVTLLGAYVRPRPRPVWSGGLVHLLGEFGFSTGAARVALARLVRRGLLARIKEGRLVYYTLTERSEHLLAEGDRRIFSLGIDIEWDGTWTILWHSIPEDRRVERSRLGRRLRFLGFGSVQDGTWISPHDREREVLELVEELGVEDRVGAVLGRPARSLHIDELINRAWDLKELTRRYEAFVAEFGAYRGKRLTSELEDREAFLVRTRLVHAFRQFPFLDPDLPDELMPGHRVRREAAETFHQVYDELAPPAQGHFDEATGKRG
jgi:phenylacetic acid degradation operon negative regulatory protein